MANEIRLLATMRDHASRQVRNLNKNLGGLKGAAKTAGHSLVTLGKVMAGLAAVGIVAVVAGLGRAAQRASDLNESMSKVNVVFGKSAKALVDWSKTTAKSLGISQQAALEAVGTFGNLFRSMRIGVKPSRDMSKQLVTLAADLASFNNASPEDVLLALRAGLVGETEPLRKFGINLNDVRLRQEAVRLGLVKTTKTVLPAAAKAQAAYSLIIKDSSLAQGDFARTADGMANRQRIAAAVIDDSMAKIGGAIAPLVAHILPPLVEGIATVATFITDKVIPAAQKWVKQNQPLINQLIGFAKTVLTVLGAAIGAAARIVGTIIAKTSKWASENQPLIKTVSTFAGQVLGTLITALGRVAGFIGKVIDILVAWFDSITANKAIMNFLRNVVGFIAAAFNAVTKAIGFALGKLGELARWIAVNGPKLRDLVNLLKFLPGGTLLSGVAGIEGRQHGGPTKRGQTYLVGEKGPELWRASGAGNITPTGAFGGGLTVNFNSVWPPTPAQAQEIANLIDRQDSYAAGRAPQSRRIT